MYLASQIFGYAQLKVSLLLEFATRIGTAFPGQGLPLNAHFD